MTQAFAEDEIDWDVQRKEKQAVNDFLLELIKETETANKELDSIPDPYAMLCALFNRDSQTALRALRLITDLNSGDHRHYRDTQLYLNYHNTQHVMNIIVVIGILIKAGKITNDEALILVMTAIYHDAGNEPINDNHNVIVACSFILNRQANRVDGLSPYYSFRGIVESYKRNQGINDYNELSAFKTTIVDTVVGIVMDSAYPYVGEPTSRLSGIFRDIDRLSATVVPNMMIPCIYAGLFNELQRKSNAMTFEAFCNNQVKFLSEFKFYSEEMLFFVDVVVAQADVAVYIKNKLATAIESMDLKTSFIR